MTDTESAPTGTQPPVDGTEPPKAEEKQKAVTFSYGIVMVRTRKLLNILDRLAEYRIFSALGWVMLGITIAAAAFMIWLMVDDIYIILNASLQFRCLIGAASAAECAAHNYPNPGPIPLQYNLLLPGLNPYIPLLYGIIGLVVAIVVHEGMHGVLARRAKLPVKSTGLLFFLFVPIGAFVEVDEKEVAKAKFRDSGRIMAGGPGSNIIVAAVTLILLLTIVGGLVPHSFNGLYVYQIAQNSPADHLHTQGYLQAGDLITAANGTQIQSGANLSSFMANTKPNQSLVLTIDHGGTYDNYTITLQANPNNKSIGFIGIVEVSQTDLKSVAETYSTAIYSKPTLYLLVPGILPQAETVVPFSNTLHGLYTSPTLGDSWYPITLTLFWIFFINANLAFFNAIPLYPLDGGQALLNFLTHFGKKSVENHAKAITAVCSGAMLVLILGFVFLPRILALL